MGSDGGLLSPSALWDSDIEHPPAQKSFFFQRSHTEYGPEKSLA